MISYYDDDDLSINTYGKFSIFRISKNYARYLDRMELSPAPCSSDEDDRLRWPFALIIMF